MLILDSLCRPSKKTNYINSRPQSVSWYNQLKNEIKTLPKEERRAENVSRPRMR